MKIYLNRTHFCPKNNSFVYFVGSLHSSYEYLYFLVNLYINKNRSKITFHKTEQKEPKI